MEQLRTDATSVTDATSDLSDGVAAAVAEPETSDGKIVAIERGRQRREGRADGDRGRADRAERRERRKQRTGSDGADALDDVDEGAATEDALAVLEGAELPQESAAELAAASKRVLTAPLMPADAPARAVDRTRSQLEVAERAVASYPEVTAAVAPLIRHVNTVTEQLNEVQVNYGQVMAERDALRMKVAELQGIDVSQVSVMPAASPMSGTSSSRHLQQIDVSQSAGHQPATAAKKFIPASITLAVGPHATPEEVKRVARRRQLIAACLFAAAGIGLVVAQRQGNDISKISRDSLADLQFVGIFFNVFFMVWMLYRVVRVGGKGANWLFPKEPNKRRR